MPALRPVDWKTLVRVFELDGFAKERIRGSHISMVKPGVLRPVVIPKKKEVLVPVIKNNMRTAGMSRERFFELLGQV